APGAANAYVRGDFNAFGLAHRMDRFEDDYILYVPGADTGDRYKYWFNGTWASDARGRWMNNNDSFNTTIVDPDAYAWQHPDFTPAPAEEWVIYQLHVGTFAGRNDPFGGAPAVSRYVDVVPRIPHLVELGVNCVMLNPINEFPGAVSGGYNSITPYAIESTYGTPDELRAMVDALHGAGIAVILDMVWNHVPSNDNLLWNYDGTQHYFDVPNVDTPWGAQADFDDPDVLRYYEESVETVIGEYRMDGFRHDAVFELVGAAQPAAGRALMRNTMDGLRRRFPDTHVIGEIYNNDPWNTAPFGIRMDAQYHEAFQNAILDAINAAGFGDPDVWRLANSIDGSGVYVNGDRVMNYFELHDDAWPLNSRQRSVRDIDPTFPHDNRYALGRTKLGNGLTILAQGMPAILMGTEWAEDSGWETSKIDWSHKTRYAGVFGFYRDLIGLRTTKRALFAHSPAFVIHVNDVQNVLAFERSGADGRSYMVVANFSNTDFDGYTVGLPRGGEWGLILNSEDERYMGTGFGGSPRAIPVSDVGADGLSHSATLRLPAHGLLVLQHEPEYIEGGTVFALLDLNEDGRVSYDDLYSYFNVLPDLTGEGQSTIDDQRVIEDHFRDGQLGDVLGPR
ncbi:MAG: alpha-amylase family glycosyl hydrolase, partial [Planctomycetota bacterium]